MPRGRGKRKAAETGRKDANPRTTKKQKIAAENLFDNLSDELIQNIFVSADYSELARFLSVCNRFNNVTKHQNFWKSLSIATFGSAIVPLRVINVQGFVDFDPAKYLLPTFSDGSKKHIDWKRYFKLRHTIENMNKAFSEHYALEKSSEDESESDEEMSEVEQSEENGSDIQSANAYKSKDDEDEDENEDEEQDDDKNEDEEEPDDVNEEEEDVSQMEDSADRSPSEYEPLEESEIDAYTKSIIFYLNDITNKDYILDRPQRLPRILAALIIEILPLFIEYSMHGRVKQCAYIMYNRGSGYYFRTNEMLVPQVFVVYEYVKYQPRLREKMLQFIVELWPAFYKQAKDRTLVPAAYKRANATNEVHTTFKRIVKEIMTSFKIVEEYDWDHSQESDFGEEDYEPSRWVYAGQANPEQSESEVDPDGEDESPCDIMRFPKRGKVHPRKRSLIQCMIDVDDPFELADPLIELIETYFNETEDLETKAFALELTTIIRKLSENHVEPLISLAIEAEKSGYERLVFNAYVIIARIISFENLTYTMEEDEDQLLEVFDILSRGIVSKPRSGLFFIALIVWLMHKLDVDDWISDERFDQLNKNILTLLSKHRRIFNESSHPPSRGLKHWDNFGHYLGTVFGARMKKYLPLYKEAIIKLAASKVKRYRPYVMQKKVPLISKPQILYQYAALGKSILGEEFEPEIEKLAESVMDKSIGFEVDMPEFIALFGDACFIVMRKDPQNLEKMIDDLLKVIPEEIHTFGQSDVMDQTSYFMDRDWFLSQWLKYIPSTLQDYKNAVDEYKKLKKPTEKQTEEIFTFKNWEPRKIEYDKERNIGYGYRGMKKTAIKYTQYHPEITQFNEMVDVEFDYPEDDMAETAKEQTNMEAAKRLIQNFRSDKEHFSIKHTQLTLRALFGFMRSTDCDPVFYETAMELYEKLVPLLSEEDKECYIKIFSIICLRTTWRHGVFQTKDGLAALQKMHSMVLDFIESSLDTETNLMEQSTDFAFNVYLKDRNCPQIYDLLKRFIEYSPRKTYQFVPNSEVRLITSKYNSEPDFICAIALLGCHFGVDFVENLGGKGARYGDEQKVDLTDLREAIFKWLKSRRKKDAEQIKHVENFMVLLTASLIDDKLKTMCLYNSVFFDEELLLNAIKNTKFDTRIKALNDRVKKWTSIKDLFDVDSL